MAADLYNALIALRPEWASAPGDDAEIEKDKSCLVKMVMTGSAEDGPDWQLHNRNKEKRSKLANRFKEVTEIYLLAFFWMHCSA